MRRASGVVRALCLAVGWLAFGSAWADGAAGNAAQGERKNAMCIGCHGIVGYKTGFPDVHRVPKLYGQNAAYIAAALAEYKQGDRKHPSMRAIAQTLSEQDMADLGAYFEATTLKRDASHATTPADAGTARALVEKAGCPACHGADFNQPISPAYPKLAGQHGDYLYFALRAYQSHDKAFIGRGNPIMGGMVKQLSDHELQVVAHYLENLAGDLATVQRGRLR